MTIIERPIYIKKILSQINRGMILVLVGQRRVGKSFILRHIAGLLKTMRPDSNVLFSITPNF